MLPQRHNATDLEPAVRVQFEGYATPSGPPPHVVLNGVTVPGLEHAEVVGRPQPPRPGLVGTGFCPIDSDPLVQLTMLVRPGTIEQGPGPDSVTLTVVTSKPTAHARTRGGQPWDRDRFAQSLYAACRQPVDWSRYIPAATTPHVAAAAATLLRELAAIYPGEQLAQLANDLADVLTDAASRPHTEPR